MPHTPDTEMLSSDEVITLPCRHGTMSVLRHDAVIGRCLQMYGEWAEAELDLLRRFVPHGGSIVDVGANVGTHSLAFASHVGHAGRVLAFEPQPFVYRLLVRNIAQNAIPNVQAHQRALGDSLGTMSLPVLNYAHPNNFGGVRLTPASAGADVHDVTVDSLDRYELSACDLLKIDVEGMESQVVAGATDTILRLRPVVYADCSSVGTGWPLLQGLIAKDYVCYVHLAQVSNPENYFGEAESIYGIACESNLLAVPPERTQAFSSTLQGNPWLLPVSTLDDLVRAVFDTPRICDLTSGQYSRWGLLSRIVRQQEDLNRLRASADTLFGDKNEGRSAAESREAEPQRIIADKERILASVSDAQHHAAAKLSQRALEVAALREDVAALRDEAAMLREEAIMLREDATMLREEVAIHRGQAAMHREEAAMLRGEAATYRGKIETLQAEACAMNAANENLERRIRDLLRSGSWRITAPLRWLLSVVARVR